MKTLVLSISLLFSASLIGASPQTPPVGGFDLKPGESIVSIDGKPVGASPQTPSNCPGGVCPAGPVTHRDVRVATRNYRREIKRDARAYNHALREARILAAEGYRRGHPLPPAPGCSRSGTGYSHSADRPVHCFSNVNESQIVARACVHCPRTGRFYWSCHLR